ncbi:hypothetical protein [Plantactinospora soyae]|uniref:Uncharacterized protein n=1 Tax=Plantactinospora soyae TaxID=1544732 RepID=A0A927RB32_9ACTN|nr:hypothetical protein [Plantactinospora soyae]MBE1491266.1 hypothetical protein [Plantactinospora soyae]
MKRKLPVASSATSGNAAPWRDSRRSSAWPAAPAIPLMSRAERVAPPRDGVTRPGPGRLTGPFGTAPVVRARSLAATR